MPLPHLQSRTGGVLGAVPSAAVYGRHSKCIISCCKGALCRHQKCTANTCVRVRLLQIRLGQLSNFGIFLFWKFSIFIFFSK